MTITETRPSVDWGKERRKKRRRRLDSVDAGLVLVAAVLLGVGSHLFTDGLFRSRGEAVHTTVPETVPSTTLAPTGAAPIALAVTPGLDGTITDHRTVTVTGTATPGAEVNIGGLRSTTRSDGSWAIAVLLKPGLNDLTVEVNGTDGSYAVRGFTITYQPSTTTLPVAPTVGTTPSDPTAEVTTSAPTDTEPATTPATTAAKPLTTTPTTSPTTAPTTTAAPVDTEPKP